MFLCVFVFICLLVNLYVSFHLHFIFYLLSCLILTRTLQVDTSMDIFSNIKIEGYGGKWPKNMKWVTGRVGISIYLISIE